MKCDIIEMYTDGACSSNPGPAGIGIVIKYNGQRKEISDYIGRSTNNKAELEAISRGLGHIMFGCSIQFLTNNVIIYTDSIYSINVISNKWKSKKNKELTKKSELQQLIINGYKKKEKKS